MRDQADRLRRLAATRPGPERTGIGDGRVIAVTSGKGGVGKTSLVANLGTVLARQGCRVTVLDADFGLANLDILLNLNPARNLGHLLRGEATGDEVVVEVEPGFRVIPGASGVEALADMDDGGRTRLMNELGALAGDPTFLLIDTAAGIGRNVIDLCLAAGEAIVVTNTEPTSLTDAYGLIKVLWSRASETRVSLVVNSVADGAEGRSVHRRLGQVVERFLGRTVDYLGHVVRDDHVGRSAVRQTPFVDVYPRCPASRCVADLARTLSTAGIGEPEAEGVRGFWTRLVSGQETEG